MAAAEAPRIEAVLRALRRGHKWLQQAERDLDGYEREADDIERQVHDDAAASEGEGNGNGNGHGGNGNGHHGNGNGHGNGHGGGNGHGPAAGNGGGRPALAAEDDDDEEAEDEGPAAGPGPSLFHALLELQSDARYLDQDMVADQRHFLSYRRESVAPACTRARAAGQEADAAAAAELGRDIERLHYDCLSRLRRLLLRLEALVDGYYYRDAR